MQQAPMVWTNYMSSVYTMILFLAVVVLGVAGQGRGWIFQPERDFSA